MEGELKAFTREAFALYWEEGGAPRGFEEAYEDEPIREAARRIGADPLEVLEGTSASETREVLKRATGEALDRGAFGAKALFVGEEMYWGNDRLFFVEAAVKNGRRVKTVKA